MARRCGNLCNVYVLVSAAHMHIVVGCCMTRLLPRAPPLPYGLIAIGTPAALHFAAAAASWAADAPLCSRFRCDAKQTGLMYIAYWRILIPSNTNRTKISDAANHSPHVIPCFPGALYRSDADTALLINPSLQQHVEQRTSWIVNAPSHLTNGAAALVEGIHFS